MDINHEDIQSVLTLCNSLQFATISLSLDMYITHVNRLAELLFSHPGHELLNKSFHDVCRELGIVAPIVSNQTAEIIEKYSVPTKHWLATHKWADVHWSVSRCMGNKGDCIAYVLVGKVIMLSSTKQPFAQLENIIHSLPIAVFSKDLKGHYIGANEYQAKMAGFNHEKEMIGKNDFDTSWLNDAAMVRKEDELAIIKNEPILMEDYLP